MFFALRVKWGNKKAAYDAAFHVLKA